MSSRLPTPFYTAIAKNMHSSYLQQLEQRRRQVLTWQTPRIPISAGTAKGRQADTSEDVSRWHRELPTRKEAVRQNHVDGVGRLH